MHGLVGYQSRNLSLIVIVPGSPFYIFCNRGNCCRETLSSSPPTSFHPVVRTSLVHLQRPCKEECLFDAKMLPDLS